MLRTLALSLCALNFGASVGAQGALAKANDSIPRYSTPSFTPCADQPRTFKALLAAYRTGRKPTAAQLKGTWAAIGMNLAEKSFETPPTPPMLACSGISRGASGVFESTLLVRGDTIWIDRIAVRLRSTPVAYDTHGALTFIADDTGPEDNDVLSCRLTPRGTLACINGSRSPYRQGEEYARLPVQPEQRADGRRQIASGVRLAPVAVAAAASTISATSSRTDIDKWLPAERKAMKDSIEAGRRRWAANRPERYRVAAYIKCGFCGGIYYGVPRGSAVALRVLGREIVGKDFVYPTVPMTGYPKWMFVPVDSLFSIVEREIIDTTRRLDELRLDPVYGFPRAWETNTSGNGGGVIVTDAGYWGRVAFFAPAPPAAECAGGRAWLGKCSSDAFEPRTRQSVDRMAEANPARQLPTFPRELWQGDSAVRVRYVIDTAGHEVFGSEALIPPSNSPFAWQVKGMAREFLFTPARLHGRPVSVRAEEVFVFRSLRREGATGSAPDDLEPLDALTDDPASVTHDATADGVPRTFLTVQRRAASPDARFSAEELLKAEQAALSTIVRDEEGAPTVKVTVVKPWASDEARAWGTITRGANAQGFGCVVYRANEGWRARCAHTIQAPGVQRRE